MVRFSAVAVQDSGLIEYTYPLKTDGKAATTLEKFTLKATLKSQHKIHNVYSPTQTSLKGPFRADGDDHQRDQELANGYADERWSAEDRYTNKTGDPRIGTHGRSYEPGEHRTGRNR